MGFFFVKLQKVSWPSGLVHLSYGRKRVSFFSHIKGNRKDDMASGNPSFMCRGKTNLTKDWAGDWLFEQESLHTANTFFLTFSLEFLKTGHYFQNIFFIASLVWRINIRLSAKLRIKLDALCIRTVYTISHSFC